MIERKIIGGVVATLFLVSGLALAQVPGQPVFPPQPIPGQPVVVPQAHYVPITIVLSVDAVKAKVLQELNGPQNPAGVVLPPQGPVPSFQPPPNVQPPVPEKRPLGGLLKKIMDKKPLQKLAALADKKEVMDVLDNISQPVNLDGDLWLSPNLQEIVLNEVNVQLPKQVVFRLAVRMEPVIVLSKLKPAPMPLPQLSLGKNVPPPAFAGTPLNVFLHIDPKAVPQVLPPDAKNELDKYGIDPAQVTFSGQPTPQGQKLTVITPMQKPLAANLQVSFLPRIKDNVLSFIDPDCAITLFPPGKAEENSVQQTLQKLTQDTIRTLVANKMKTTTVDFAPHLKKLSNLPLGQPNAPSKVQAVINNLHVADLGATNNNHLVVRISGLVAKEGIVIYAP